MEMTHLKQTKKQIIRDIASKVFFLILLLHKEGLVFNKTIFFSFSCQNTWCKKKNESLVMRTEIELSG